MSIKSAEIFHYSSSDGTCRGQGARVRVQVSLWSEVPCLFRERTLREGTRDELPLVERRSRLEEVYTVRPREHSESVAGPCRPETHFLPFSHGVTILQSPLLSGLQMPMALPPIAFPPTSPLPERRHPPHGSAGSTSEVGVLPCPASLKRCPQPSARGPAPLHRLGSTSPPQRSSRSSPRGGAHGKLLLNLTRTAP